MQQSFKDMAQRLVNAESGFIDSVVERLGCSREDGAKILAIYRKNKIVKLELAVGRFTVKHGAFWDVDVLRRALEA